MDEYLQPLSLELHIRTIERYATDTGMHFRQPYMLTVDAQHELRHGRALGLGGCGRCKVSAVRSSRQYYSSNKYHVYIINHHSL
jgi:hypothetical protein